MCWETKASRPRVTVMVDFSWPPSASVTGPSSASGIGSGTKPRARRSKAGAPARICATLSSARIRMGRSWVTMRSATPARRLLASALSTTNGSPAGLAEVATSAVSVGRAANSR